MMQEGVMTVEIIFETHSITVDNEAGIATGWLPGRLSAAGREAQASAIAPASTGC